jgi:hypothetical protein
VSKRFPVVSVARGYIERYEEYLGYLGRLSDKGLHAHAEIALAEQHLPPLVGERDRAELMQICVSKYWPHVAEATRVITGTEEES